MIDWSTRTVATLALLVVATPMPVRAHPLAPALLDLREDAAGRVMLGWKVPLVHARGTGLAPVLPPHCRRLAAPEVTTDATGVRWTWPVTCGTEGLAGSRIGVDGLDPGGLTALVRVTFADGRVVRGIVTGSSPSLVVPVSPRPADVAASYLALGVRHILGGPDHLLFVLGLLLLAGGGRLLVGTITAFTLGHSVTLSLAILGLLEFPLAWTEVGIALSVFLLACELARAPRAPTLLRRRPWLAACTFGLLHGLGFAGALREAGLPPGEVPLALLAFNAGVEVGQLAVVAGALGLGRVVSRSPALPAWAPRVPVYAMGVLAAFWCFERVAAALP